MYKELKKLTTTKSSNLIKKYEYKIDTLLHYFLQCEDKKTKHIFEFGEIKVLLKEYIKTLTK